MGRSVMTQVVMFGYGDGGEKADRNEPGKIRLHGDDIFESFKYAKQKSCLCLMYHCMDHCINETVLKSCFYCCVLVRHKVHFRTSETILWDKGTFFWDTQIEI